MLTSAIVYFAGRVGAALVVLLAISIYTRLLSPAEYGIYALVVSGVTMTYAATMQWLAFSLGRFLPAYPEREDIVLSHVAASYLVVALIVVLGVLLATPFLELDANRFELLGLGVIFFLAVSFSELSLAVFQARRQPLFYIGFALLRVAFAGAIGIALAYFGWGSVGLLVGLVVGNLCISLPNALLNWRVVFQAVGAAIPDRARRLWLAFRHDGCARSVHHPVGPLHPGVSDRGRGDRSVCRLL